jgi:hypothetical protein
MEGGETLEITPTGNTCLLFTQKQNNKLNIFYTIMALSGKYKILVIQIALSS